MLKDANIAVWIGVAAVLVTAAVFRFPALTTGGSVPGVEVPEAEFQQIVQGEREHCDTNLAGVDCVCFAGVSGLILADQSARVARASYADKTELARGQAKDKC